MKISRIIVWIPVLVLLSLQFFIIEMFQISASAGSNQTVLVSEINYAGSIRPDCPDCAFDKWIELINNGSETIALDGWKLRFKNSFSANNTLTLPAHYLHPNQTYLIGIARSSLESTLNTSGIQANYYSGKVLNVSNNEDKTVQVVVERPDGSSSHTVDLSRPQLESLEQQAIIGNKYSLQYSGSWALASTSYFAQNFGTPKATPLATTPPKPEPLPEPVATAPKAVVAPAPETSPAPTTANAANEVQAPVFHQALPQSSVESTPASITSQTTPVSAHVTQLRLASAPSYQPATIPQTTPYQASQTSVHVTTRPRMDGAIRTFKTYQASPQPYSQPFKRQSQQPDNIQHTLYTTFALTMFIGFSFILGKQLTHPLALSLPTIQGKSFQNE